MLKTHTTKRGNSVMSHKKLLVLTALVAVTGFTAVSSTTARGLEEDTTTTSEMPKTTTTEMQKQRVEERKTEIKERIEAKKTEVREKLADKRLEMCERRQANINKIFDNATERNEKHLAVFQKIEERVKEFYVSKNLSAEGYDAAVAAADEKEAAAIAAIEASTEVTFDCATADGAKPGSAIKEAMSARHTALKEYRTAVKDLILVVKKQHGQQQNAEATVEQEPTTEGEQ